MKLFLSLIVLIVLPTTALCAQAGYIEVTAPGNRQLKLAAEIPHAQNNAAANTSAAKEMADVIAFDMNMSGTVTADVGDPRPLAGYDSGYRSAGRGPRAPCPTQPRRLVR